MQRALIVIGLVLVAAGFAWPWLAKLGLGRLPGDIRIETENGVFYFPLVTCIVLGRALARPLAHSPLEKGSEQFFGLPAIIGGKLL